MADDIKQFPTGSISMGSGDLIDVTNVKVAEKNNGSLVHTLKRNPAGVRRGKQECTVSFDAVCSEDGIERDYLKDIKTGRIKQIRLKIPGETLVITGMATDRSVETSLDDAIKYSIEFIGKSEAA